MPSRYVAYSKTIQSAIQSPQISSDSVVSAEVSCNGTVYRKGKFAIIGKSEHGFLFGEIEFVIITQLNKVYFLVKEHEAAHSENIHVHIIQLLFMSVTNDYKCVE